ncbi:MAG: dihydroorotate dehydrogenase electron transfer subunit [Deltaproteobacteria bacterium HGW-Deltaproteobacteria-19]|nr:MAG: dihydroorotate dehydrogenase electron transfer subunit [Deltaproteobacteria bacterium HGW-Deltaproteobacteria-19]
MTDRTRQEADRNVEGVVLSNRETAPGHFHMVLGLPVPIADPVPGQFVMVRMPDRLDPLLARPLGIYGFSRQAGEARLELLYRVAGKGTALLSGLSTGRVLQVLGPLGRGFRIVPELRTVILVAGGIGIAPLTFLAEHYRGLPAVVEGREIVCYVGARCSEALVGLERMEALCSRVVVTTDDGTCGACGIVTEPLGLDLPSFRPGATVIYACGPGAMLRCLADMLRESPVPCQVSVEERMACGLGACLGCAVAIRSGENALSYVRVCKEGPVFDIHELDWK